MGSRYIIIDNGTIKRTDVDRDSAVFADNVNDAVTQKRADKSAMLVIPDTYKELSFIEENEYKEFEDYIFSRYFGKKTVVVYGNCHTTVISDYLENCAEFKQEYILYRIKPIQTIDDTGYFDHPIFRYCDVFVHQSIQLKNRYGEEYASENIVKRLKPECRVISIPNVYGLPVCFFPQYIRDTEYKNEVGITVFFRDSLLDALGNKHIFPGKIYKEYISDKTLKVSLF